MFCYASLSTVYSTNIRFFFIRLQGRNTTRDRENTAAMTSRATRAKIMATSAQDGALGLKAKLPTRRRAALGDLSNVAKGQQTLLSVKDEKLRVKPALNTQNNIHKANSPAKAHAEPLTRHNGLQQTHREKYALEEKSSSQEHKQRVLANFHSSTSNNGSTSDPSKSSLKRTRTMEEVAESKDDDFFVETDVTTHNNKRAKVQAWDDLDQEDFDDPLMVAEYGNDIFEYMYELEKKYMPNPNYIEDQRELEWSQRGMLMDWLVEIHTRLHLLPETLYLAGNIVDRFMTLRVVNLDKIQLVGVTALLLAAKYEEVFPPVLHYFAYVTGGNFDENDILAAEKFMLQVLEFEFSYPNPLNFLRRISKADNYDVQSRSFGKYLLEISVVHHELIEFPPSLCAAGAMYVARHILGRPEWDANLVHYSGDHSEKAVQNIARILVVYLANPVEHEALFKKYASRKFYKASMIARQWAKENKSSLNFMASS